ncbi:Imm51 family immunity protein [Spirillospora sp. CA-253888]
MSPLRLIETTPGAFSLLLGAGETQVDEVIEDLGHEPNGYFWDGIAQFLVATEASALEGRFSYDSEGGMFCAYGKDRTALQELAALMGAVATDEDRLRKLVESAVASGFEFDD